MTTTRLPAKVLIANRGEIAVRIARTCRAMGIATVAVHSDPDAAALHVEVADEAVSLGGTTPAENYLRVDALIDAAHRTGATAVHPGYGFLAENAAFAQAVIDAGLTWIGPPPAAIAAMGDKLEAKARMEQARVPLIAGARLDDPDADPAASAETVGYPLMVKAAAGGGGKGMRIVTDLANLSGAVAAARREAESAFGDGRVFLERYLTRPRHVEVQVVADVHGNVVHAYERECSIQRRHQKVIEESPSPGIDPEVRAALCDAAVAAAKAIGYVNAGTVEFVADEAALARRRAGEDVDPRDCFAFLEVNTRLQVEHPVTEQVVKVRGDDGLADLDLVRVQLLVAAGEPLAFTQDQLVQVGHAIEARLYAEDPAQGHLPIAGALARYRPHPADGVRYDDGVRSGDVISPHYDPMLAKVIATAPTRAEAAARLAHALERTGLLGLTTNRDLLVALLRHPAFLAGDTTTGFLDEHFADPGSSLAPDAEVVRAAVLDAVLAGIARRSGSWPVPSLPSGFSNTGAFDHSETLLHGDGEHPVTYRRIRDGSWRLKVGEDVEVTARVLASTDDGTVVEVEGRRHHLDVLEEGDDLAVRTGSGWVALRRQARFPEPGSDQPAGATVAPMPGRVVSLAVTAGQQVEAGDLLVVVEAMKMEHRITAVESGSVTAVPVSAGQQVDAGDVLVVVGSDGPDDAEADAGEADAAG